MGGAIRLSSSCGLPFVGGVGGLCVTRPPGRCLGVTVGVGLGLGGTVGVGLGLDFDCGEAVGTAVGVA